MKKLLNILGNCLLVIVILLASIVTVFSLNSKDRGVPNVFGYVPMSIQTDSMKGVIDPGDLIIGKKYNQENLKVGDIVTFFSMEGEETILKTHRIVRINKVNDTVMYATKGDNAPGEDQTQITKNDVVAIFSSQDYNGLRLPFVGKALTFLQSQTGFMAFIIIPLIIFFIYQLYKFIETVIEEKKKQAILEIEKAKQKA